MRLPDDVPCFERLCSRTVGRPVKDMIREELDQEQEFNDDLDLTRIRTLTSIIARIQYFLGENDDILRAKDRKQRNRIFRAIHDGKFEVVLRLYRQFTETAAAANPFTLTKKRGNKARDAARQAVASVGLEMVVGHQRRFVEDLRSAPTLSLLPMVRYARKSVHELAHAFSLKGMIEGNSTMLGGVRADERNVYDKMACYIFEVG
ncbi:hypothetical protein EDB86DRAFT_2906402 [Lactarius hatsudake]|nr:hypothetical protein EDB86DRAFT_2906402 [Lactarius hatsudake]